MKDTRKTKAQLVEELEQLRAANARLGSAGGETLRPNRQLMGFLIDQMLEPTVMLDFEGNVLHGNELAAGVLGLDSAAGIPGLSLAAVMHPDSLQQAAADLAAVKQATAPFSASYMLLINGRTVHIESHGHRIDLADGPVDLVSFRDVTKRREKEERDRSNELILRSVLDHSSTVIFIKDLDGKYLLINKRYEELFGITNEEIAGKTDFDVFPAEAAEQFQAKDRKAVAAGGPIEEEELVPHEDGVHTYISVKFPMYGTDGTLFATCGIATDITERKQAEDALARHHDDLEARVAERTRELTEVNRKLHEEVADRELAEEELAIFKRFADASGQGFGMADLDGTTTYLNPELCRILELDRPEDGYGKPIREFHPDDSWRTLEVEALPRVMDSGEWNGETALISRTGRVTPVIQSLFLLRDGKGNPIKLASVLTDITERKRAERALTESEAKYRALFENSVVGQFRVAVGGKMLDANRAMAEMFGWDDLEAFVDSCDMAGLWVDPEDRAKMYAIMKEHGELENFETRFLRKDGSTFPLRVSSKMYPEFGYQEGICIDISEEKSAIDALVESERKFRALAESTTAQITIIQDDRYTYANQAFLDYHEIEPADLQLITPEELGMGMMTPEAIEQATAVWRAAMERGESHFRVEFPDVDGNWFQTNVAMVELDGKPSFIGMTFDITELKRTQEKLAESEKRYRTIFDAAATAMISCGDDAVITLANDEWVSLTGYSKEETEGKLTWMPFFTGETLERMQRYHEMRSKDPQSAPRFYEARLIDRHGEPHDGIVTVDMVPGTKQRVASFQDITDLKRAQEEIKQSEERYRTIFDTAGTGMISFGADAVITLANEEWAKLSGYSIEETVGKLTWMPFFTEQSLAKMRTYHEMRTRDPSSVPTAYEAQFVDRAGNIHEGIINIQVVPGTQQRVASFQDMTELKRAQKEMYRADKMAALGQIIAGVAHEINNPNNFIYFNLPILRRYVEAIAPLLEERCSKEPGLKILNMPFEVFLEDVFKLLENMEHGSTRITSIVSDLRNYVRSDEDQDFKFEQVAQAVERVMTLVGKQVRKMVKRFDVEVAEGLPPVKMNVGKIEQVLINLVINAGQAVDKEDSWVKLSARSAVDSADWVELLVEDNGVGILDENLEQIFEPFFTSKGREQGTGLGLSISQRIVEEHGGTIGVESAVGVGTVFTIRLPAAPVA